MARRRVSVLVPLVGVAVAGTLAANAATASGVWSTMSTGVDSHLGLAYFTVAAGESGQAYLGGIGLPTSVGGVSVNYVAGWGGSSWSALGSGLNNAAKEAVVDESGRLVVGGLFTTAGGASATYVAIWDGTSWSAPGGGLPRGVVESLATYGSTEIFVGVDNNGSYPTEHIATWDGSSWSWALATGFNDDVGALALDESGNLYAGGSFTVAGRAGSTISANRIAEWNRASDTWSALGTGVNGTVASIVPSSSGLIYAAGNFSQAGGNSASNIAVWDPTASSWSALGAGVNGTVTSIVEDACGTIYAGGNFTQAGGASANNIASWDPVTSTWSPLGAGTDQLVWSLAIDEAGILYVAGAFTTAGGNSANYVAQYFTGCSSSGSSDPSQWPSAPLQQFEVDEGTLSEECADIAAQEYNNHVDWPGIADLRSWSWGASWAMWPNEGTGGFVCTRQPFYTGSRWWVR